MTAPRWHRQVSKDKRYSKWYWELTRSFCLSIVWRKEITHQGSSEDQGAEIRLLGLNPVGMKDEWPVARVRDRSFLSFGIQSYHVVLWNIPLKEISCLFSKIVLPKCSVSNKALAFSIWEGRSCWQGSLSYLADVYCAPFWARNQSTGTERRVDHMTLPIRSVCISGRRQIIQVQFRGGKSRASCDKLTWGVMSGLRSAYREESIREAWERESTQGLNLA